MKGRRFSMMLERALVQEESKAEEDQRLRKGIEKVLDRAAEGDLASLNMIADRLDGKPSQQVDLGNKDGEPFVVKIEATDANL